MVDARPTEAGGELPETPEARLTAPGAPFAVSEGVYVSGPRTLREFVETTWAYGDRVFLVSEDGATTYREFFDAACGLARQLTGEYGLRPGDRAVVAMRNLPEWQIAFWAAQLAGLVAVPLNAWWTEDEFAYALDDCAPGVLLVDGERVARVRAWARERKVPGIVFHGEAEDGFRAYVPDTDPHLGPPDVDVLPEQDATVIYTSGTTGRPKGAVATHLAQAGAAMNPRYFAAAAALARGDVPGTGPAPVSLTTFPFFHVAAFTSFYAVMSAGGTLVMMRKWDADRALELIGTHGVTHYAGVPTTALQLLEAARAAGDELATLTLLSTGGAAAPPGIVAGITEGYGERVEPRNGYGLTETSGGVLSNVGAEYRAHPDSVGRPTPTTEVRIEGPDAAGVGELWLRGQALVRGYWGNEEATRAAFSEDGWFRTGDLARVDADGRVTVVDRLTDMVIRGGENVYCVEVEGVLQGHPDVLDAAVLGVPHPLLGEEVAAVVRLRPGATTGAEDLRTYVGGRLAAFKVPARVVVREEELPRNPTGKLLKRELRGGLAAG
ncbi:class I adenylate-forming enzyme family protein [Streptomyces sp. SR27]|uniref:class I adenylate-forming enzyme family protein n=1 Tax=unclassified Streptomyces TaxID=2593676 RepID=UPI00295AC7C6|nr:class I adenylate-forming enzyme family protein [Streptomyces sp. SR27]MDV9187881.1 class I adenylate-forming enzyme family protein [Streptomyces sp. SR27]